jgi:hypothetical protein
MKRAARLAVLVLLVLLVWLAADADAKWRASSDTGRLSQKFCEQQDALRSLPKRFNLGPNPDPAIVKLVLSVGKIQRSGANLYLTFDCPRVR